MTEGKKRIIIENVQPVVDGGIYPAKRAVGERVDVTAAIFGDGHDHIRASLFYKKKQQDRGRNPMNPTFNDEWLASFYVQEKGNYFLLSKRGLIILIPGTMDLKRKPNAKIDVKVELMEGAVMLRKLGKKNSSLISLARKLENSAHYAESIELILSDDFAKVVHDHPLKEIFTSLDIEHPVVVESSKNQF